MLFFICTGKYYVVDAGYPNRPGIEVCNQILQKKKFNRIHSSICNVIERSFGVLKMKWQILYKMPPYSMLTQKKVVAATMILHNFIREHASRDVDFANLDCVLTISERYNKYVVSQHASDGSTSESSFVTMDSFRDSLATSVALAWS